MAPSSEAGGMDRLNRRDLLGAGMAAGAAAWTLAGRAEAATQLRSPLSAGAAPTDRDYWRGIAAQYDLPPDVVQLENGNWGMMARPVVKAYERKIEMVNTATSLYSRRGFGPDFTKVRDRAARMMGVATDEIAFTRGATEALETLIGGYNRLRPGDQILYSDLDYDSTQAGFRWLARKRGVELVTFQIPEPATWQGLIDAYARVLDQHPKVRLMLLTHVGHRTGLVMPVREIIALAKARGVDVILDSAHAWGQLDFDVGALGADFVGLTCQKWMGAPIGVGIMYVRKERLDTIDVNIGVEGEEGPDSINRRIHTGTSNYAAFLAAGDAFDFHEAIGAKPKEARLRYLRDRWAETFRDDAVIEILTPSDPRLTGALTSFRLRGQTSVAQNKALAAELLDRFRIFTVQRDGVASGSCVRVTPGIFTSEDDVDRLIAALKIVSREGKLRA
jgi:selenocysteine lyase/cysteine desulfurase